MASVLQRKLAPPPVREETAAPGAAAAVPRALLRAGEAAPALAAEAAGVAESRLSLPELLDLADPGALSAVLEGPGGTTGLAVLPSGFFSAVVEAATTGRVAAVPGPERRASRTDAALCAPVLDGFLAALGQELETHEDRVWAGGFRAVSWPEDPRQLALLLEDVTYRRLSVSLRLGMQGREAALTLAFPAAGRGTRPPPPPPVEDAPAPSGWQAGLEARLAPATVTLDAVLVRLSLPIATLADLAPGTVLPLGTAELGRIALVDADGRPVAEGRLGQSQGRRALRLTSGVE